MRIEKKLRLLILGALLSVGAWEVKGAGVSPGSDAGGSAGPADAVDKGKGLGPFLSASSTSSATPSPIVTADATKIAERIKDAKAELDKALEGGKDVESNVKKYLDEINNPGLTPQQQVTLLGTSTDEYCKNYARSVKQLQRQKALSDTEAGDLVPAGSPKKPDSDLTALKKKVDHLAEVFQLMMDALHKTIQSTEDNFLKLQGLIVLTEAQSKFVSSYPTSDKKAPNKETQKSAEFADQLNNLKQSLTKDNTNNETLLAVIDTAIQAAKNTLQLPLESPSSYALTLKTLGVLINLQREYVGNYKFGIGGYRNQLSKYNQLIDTFTTLEQNLAKQFEVENDLDKKVDILTTRLEVLYNFITSGCEWLSEYIKRKTFRNRDTLSDKCSAELNSFKKKYDQAATPATKDKLEIINTQWSSYDLWMHWRNTTEQELKRNFVDILGEKSVDQSLKESLSVAKFLIEQQVLDGDTAILKQLITQEHELTRLNKGNEAIRTALTSTDTKPSAIQNWLGERLEEALGTGTFSDQMLAVISLLNAELNKVEETYTALGNTLGLSKAASGGEADKTWTKDNFQQVAVDRVTNLTNGCQQYDKVMELLDFNPGPGSSYKPAILTTLEQLIKRQNAHYEIVLKALNLNKPDAGIRADEFSKMVNAAIATLKATAVPASSEGDTSKTAVELAKTKTQLADAQEEIATLRTQITLLKATPPAPAAGAAAGGAGASVPGAPAPARAAPAAGSATATSSTSAAAPGAAAGSPVTLTDQVTEVEAAIRRLTAETVADGRTFGGVFYRPLKERDADQALLQEYKEVLSVVKDLPGASTGSPSQILEAYHKELNGAIDQLKGKLQSIASTFSPKVAVDGIISQIDALQGFKTNVGSKLGLSGTSTDSDILTKIESLKQDSTTLLEIGRITELGLGGKKATAEIIQAKLTGLNTQLTTLNQANTTLGTAKTTLETENADLKTKNTNLEVDKSKLIQVLNYAGLRLNDVKAAVQRVNDIYLSSQQSTEENVSARYKTLEDAINSLWGTVDIQVRNALTIIDTAIARARGVPAPTSVDGQVRFGLTRTNSSGSIAQATRGVPAFRLPLRRGNSLPIRL